MRNTFVTFLLWVLLLHVSEHARAAPKEPPEYSRAVALGLAEFEDRNFAEARAQFTRAHTLSPSARTLRALGMVEFELKHYAESAHLLSEALHSPVKPLEDDKRAHAEQLLERANSYIGRLTLDMEPGTTLTIDAVPSALDSGSELVLEVGDHALEFHATARIGQKRTITIHGGEHEPLQVRLAALESPPPASEAPSKPAPLPTDAPKERRARKSPWLWTAVGIVVAGAAAGAAIALTRDTTTKTEAPYAGSGGAPPLGTPR